MQDSIEREIFIRADIERVWSLVSRAGFWVGDTLRFDAEAREGETVVIETEQYGRFPVQVVRLDPPRYAAYRWASAFPNSDLSATNATSVEFTLTPQDGGVLVTVRESGFATIEGTDEFRAARYADNVSGWGRQLEQLRQVAEGVPV